jgi:hypothetical protein
MIMLTLQELGECPDTIGSTRPSNHYQVVYSMYLGKRYKPDSDARFTHRATHQHAEGIARFF